VPTGDNGGKIGYGVSGGTGLRWSEIHAIDIYASQFHWTGNLLPGADNTYDIGVAGTRWRDLYLAGAIKALVGGVAVDLVPAANNTYNIGAVSNRFTSLFLTGLGDLGSLGISGTTVITPGRLLQNVTADAAIIASGRFPLARLLDGTAGYVLEAEGAGFDPMYVNPNGRYTPAAHNHAAGNITSGVLDEARCPNVYFSLITFNGGINSNGYKIAGTPGVSGSFTTVDGKTVTVNNGIITSIV
jgi:hypothetical protein